jgi:hypothetical protein
VEEGLRNAEAGREAGGLRRSDLSIADFRLPIANLKAGIGHENNRQLAIENRK